jgi:hypothetical protein
MEWEGTVANQIIGGTDYLNINGNLTYFRKFIKLECQHNSEVIYYIC